MTLKTACCHSDAVDTAGAIAAVLKEADQKLQGAVPVAGLLFASVEYEHPLLLGALQARWPGLPLIGCSGDGEISSAHGLSHDSVLLVLFYGQGVRARVGLGLELSRNPARAAAQAVSALGAHEGRLIVTTFAPTTNSSEVLRCLEGLLGPGRIPLVGGLSGTHPSASQTLQYCGSRVEGDSLPLLVLEGDFCASWGVASGWFPIGKQMRVDESSGHLVQSIDGQRAYDVYQSYYSADQVEGLRAYPLALYADGPDREPVLRAVINGDPLTGSLQFAGEVPAGSILRLTEVLPEGVLSGTQQSIQQALERYPGRRPELALLFSCAARKWVLGGRAGEDVERMRAALPTRGGQNIEVAGTYCFGEIVPPEGMRESRLHNETCVSLLLGS
jgi:hypothetical protein